MTHRQTNYLALSLMLLLVATCGSLVKAAPFHNTVNLAFNSRCNGPQGAIVVEEASAAYQTAGVGPAVMASHHPQSLATAQTRLQRMKRLGLMSHQAEFRFPRPIVHTRNGRLVRPDLLQTAQTGGLGAETNQINFTFEGWNSGDRAALQNYLTTAMPKIRLFYGPPAFDLSVKVIRDNTISNLQGGTYDTATNEIRIPPLSGNFPEDTYILLMLVLQAFHDDALLFYDAWEQGMIGAAAYVIQTQPGVSPGYDPIDPGPFYALSVYECQNLPELGNSTFYPASGATNMLVWRIAMARAAWLKCWIESPSFFADFNRRYYAAYNASLPGDVPSLKELAAQAVSTVEGFPFVEWYERQYVLDTSIRTGDKLFTWNIPLTQSVGLITELYRTLPDGDEEPFGGQARTIYWNDRLDIQLYAEEGNVISIPPGGSTPGEGFLLPTFFNIGGPQRITVQIDVAGQRRYYPFAYNVRGFDPGENNIYGAMLGANVGSIDLATNTSNLTGIKVTRGVWGDHLTTGPLSPRQVMITFTAESGEVVSRRINIGWDSYCCFLESGPQATSNHTLTYGLNGLHLMSLPLQPLEPDAAAVLGISAEQLLMAWWDPLFSGENKYRLWPAFSFRSPGHGYWLRIGEDTTISLKGIQPSPTKPYELRLSPGWNLIGSPRLDPVPLANIQIQAGEDTPLSWADAVVNRLVQNGLYSYSQTAGYKIADRFEPWLGYWVRCLEPRGVALLFPGTTSAASVQMRSQATLRPTWRLPLRVTAGPLQSETTYLALAAGANRGYDVFDLVAPPNLDEYAQVRFVQQDWGRNSGHYLTDVRPATANAERWTIEVACTLPNTLVTLSWPRVGSLTQGLHLTLYDPATGHRLRMLPTNAYQFQTGPRGGTRPLVIELGNPGPTVGALRVTSIGRVVTVRYGLSAPAIVDVVVTSRQGGLVRTVARQIRQPQGAQTITWDTRDHKGKPVSDGAYQVRVTATAPGGSIHSASAWFQVRRSVR